MDVPIPDDWEGEYCCYSVMWPKSRQYLAILRGLIVSAASGRFYLASTGDIREAQQIIRETFDHNFANEEVLMSCNDATAAALQAIATALTNQTTTGGGAGCCGGSTGGAGQFPPLPGGVDTTGETPGEGDPPTGYDSWGQFEQQRCGVATQIIQDIQSSLSNIVIMLIAGLSVEGVVELLIVALTLTVSTAGLAAIAGLLLTLGGTVICATALSLVNDNANELICALLSGTNSATSRTNFLNKWSEIVDDAPVDVIEGFAMKQLMAYLVGTEETNRLYTPNSAIDYSSYECTCNETMCFEFTESTEDWSIGGDAVSFSPFPQIGDMSWDGGTLMLDLEVDGNQYGIVQSPTFIHTIVEGESICRNIVDATSGSFSNYVEAIIDGELTELSAESSSPIGVNTFSLDPYIGQEITQIILGFSRTGSGAFVKIAKAGICETCSE